MTLAGKLLQSIQNLGPADADRDFLVLALSRPDLGHAVPLGVGVHLLAVTGEVNCLGVGHSTCQVTSVFFSRIRLPRLLQKHRQCKF